MNKIILLSFLFVTLFVSCNLDELPKDSGTDAEVFGTESGLNTYTNSFYTMLPSAGNIYEGDNLSDIVAVSSLNTFIRQGYYSESQGASGWNQSDWEDLRSINYFLEKIKDSSVDSDVKKNYIGIARFFRAYFYFEKVKRFGDVPWYNTALDHDSEELFNPRDSRVLIMDSIMQDFDYAIENIASSKDATASTITSEVALAYKSRVALFEGTFRKYNTQFNLQGSADEYLRIAAEAAKQVIDNGEYKLYDGAGVDYSYRELFISKKPLSDEVMLAKICSAKLNVFNEANRKFISPTYGNRPCLTRKFVNTYLNIDGTPFTEVSGYNNIEFYDETQDRDARLLQTIRSADYIRTSSGAQVVSPPDFGTTFTGYQPIKFCFDEINPYDNESLNDNAITYIRYAEVLLNYAEAKAELGEMDNDVWDMTIAALRSRAGLTGGLTMPTVADVYLQDMYPGITDANILEVRRERAIELVFEGFRFDDLRRWHMGERLEDDFTGIYVPQTDRAIDFNGDGIYDVLFYLAQTGDADELNGVKAQYTGAEYGTMVFIPVASSSASDLREDSHYELTNETSGELMWVVGVQKEFTERMYLYPIPFYARTVNPALGQNPGW